MNELEAEQGAGALGSGGLLQTQQNRGTGAQGWMRGWGGRGMGGPATAGKRWPHFFQMGKLRHKEVWELAQGHSQ